MSRIRGKNTKPEILLRREIWHRGLRYRLTHKIFGRPDIIFIRAKVVIFVDGCFWHGCPEHGNLPKSNPVFWQAKLEKNRRRDELVNQTLAQQEWKVLRFWEHQVNADVAICADVIEGEVHAKRF